MLHVYDFDSAPNADYPDVYFSANYGWAVRDETTSWISIQAFDRRWQIPLHVREIREGVFDAASPYGYSGVYCDDLTSEEQNVAWSLTIEALRERGVVSVFLRHSPLVSQAELLAEQKLIVSDHATTALRLSRGTDTLWSNMQGRSRTAVRKARKEGLCVEVRSVTSADVAPGSSFRLLYQQTMDRNNATDSYLYADSYFERLQVSLGDNLLIAEVADAGQEVGASALLLRHGDLLHYHLSGSNREAARLGANNLLIWGVVDWASEHGLRLFHLGGGVVNEDPLWRFKSAFGGERLRYQASGLVVNKKAYRALAVDRAARLGTSCGQLDETYFPLYRSGVTS